MTKEHDRRASIGLALVAHESASRKRDQGIDWGFPPAPPRQGFWGSTHLYRGAMRPPERPWPSLELTSTGVLAPQVTELPVPPLESDAGGIGHGSSVLVHSIRHQIYWSRPYGRQPVPWSRYDLPSGDLRTVTGRNGLHGDLRDWVIDPDGRHAWSLLTHGLARLDLEEMREVAILRTRFPKFLVSLMDLGNGLLAAAHWTGETITLVDREQLRIVKTLRMPSPQAAVLGRPISHSLSPVLHRDAYAATLPYYLYSFLSAPDGSVGRAAGGPTFSTL